MALRQIQLAPDVTCVPVGFANVYFIGEAAGSWVLVDTGVPGRAGAIQKAAEQRFGAGTKPECILLTHGHFDHSGSAEKLATQWQVPVYAHRLEVPYLTGTSQYPPADPTTPGFLAFLSRFMVQQQADLGDRLRVLEEGRVPGLPDWRWVHTPGHSPGHVSFFRSRDALLIAGDAFATVNLNSLVALARKQQRISNPPAPFTCDWAAAERSLRHLDALNPLVFAAGHGLPMAGAEAAEEFQKFAYEFRRPAHGRYVSAPAITSENGVVALPPAPADPGLGKAGALAIFTLAGALVAVAARRRQRGVAA